MFYHLKWYVYPVLNETVIFWNLPKRDMLSSILRYKHDTCLFSSGTGLHEDDLQHNEMGYITMCTGYTVM